MNRKRQLRKSFPGLRRDGPRCAAQDIPRGFKADLTVSDQSAESAEAGERIQRSSNIRAFDAVAAYFCGSMTTFMESPPSATSRNPSPVCSSGNRWVIMRSTGMRPDRISSMATIASRGLFP